MVDVFCRNGANGVLDKYATEFSGQEHLGINPLGHAEGARGRLLYHLTGYCFGGAASADNADATTRINARAAYVTGPTGTQAMLNRSGADGGYVEGLGYWMSEVLQSIGFVDFWYHDAYAFAMSDASVWATGANPIHEFYPLWMTHLIVPYQPVPSSTYRTYLLLKGPQSSDTTMDSDGNYPDTSQFTGAYLKNLTRVYASSNPSMAKLARWLVEKMYYATGDVPLAAGNSNTYRWALWANFIGYNSGGITASSPAALGLPKNKCFAYGQCFFRDAWTHDGTSSLVTLYASPWQWTAPLEYTQAAHGSFSIHYGGPIVIEPGTGAHNALQESGWGGNTIVFPRPAESRGGRTFWDKGGARPLRAFPLVSGTGDLTEGAEVDLGGLKTTACGGRGGKCARLDISDSTAAHQYQYVYVDLCRGYNGTQNKDDENTEKCVNFERQIANFQPPAPGTSSGFAVIWDRVTTPDAGVEPRWQLFPAAHTTVTSKTMTISGAAACVPATEECTTRNNVETPHWTGNCGGALTGTIAYTGNAGLAAKGFWTPLLPSACKIVERGGPNAANVPYQADSHEFEDPYGVHGATARTTNDSVGSSGADYLRPWSGSYRYELLYQTTATTSPFLNVIEYAAPRTTTKQRVTRLNGTNTTGVRIDAADARCAVFKTDAGALTTGDFELATADTFDCLIADLPPSTAITFAKGANVTSISTIADRDADLTYMSTAQGTLWLRIVVGSAGTGPGNTIRW
jgi:hypothetical protein